MPGDSSEEVWAGLAQCIVSDLVGLISDPLEREKFWLALQLERLDPRRIRADIHAEIFDRFLPGAAMLLVLLGLSVIGVLTATFSGLLAWTVGLPWTIGGLTIAAAASPRARPTRTTDVGIRCQRMKTAPSGRTDLPKRALGDLHLEALVDPLQLRCSGEAQNEQGTRGYGDTEPERGRQLPLDPLRARGQVRAFGNPRSPGELTAGYLFLRRRPGA